MPHMSVVLENRGDGPHTVLRRCEMGVVQDGIGQDDTRRFFYMDGQLEGSEERVRSG